jgi:hypothetical protein
MAENKGKSNDKRNKENGSSVRNCRCNTEARLS